MRTAATIKLQTFLADFGHVTVASLDDTSMPLSNKQKGEKPNKDGETDNSVVASSLTSPESTSSPTMMDIAMGLTQHLGVTSRLPFLKATTPGDDEMDAGGELVSADDQTDMETLITRIQETNAKLSNATLKSSTSITSTTSGGASATKIKLGDALAGLLSQALFHSLLISEINIHVVTDLETAALKLMDPCESMKTIADAKIRYN